MEQIFVDMKKGLQEITGDRMIKMVLYGSRARGDFSIRAGRRTERTTTKKKAR